MTELRDPLEGVVTTADLADELGVQPETVVRWCREHRIGSYKQGGRFLIRADEARTFAASYGIDQKVEDEEEGWEDDEEAEFEEAEDEEPEFEEDYE